MEDFKDVDNNHNTDAVNKAVESEIANNEAVMPKEGTATSSFKLMVAQLALAVISLFITFAVGAKWIGADMGENLHNTLTQGMTLVTMFFGAGATVVGSFYVHGRNKVAQIKAGAAADIVRAKANGFVGGKIEAIAGEPAQFSSGVLGSSIPMGAFGMSPINMAVMGINMALMFLGNAKTGKKGNAVKALKAAAAALAEYQASE
jgi:hypothetical protein